MRQHILDSEVLYINGGGRRPTTHHRVLYRSVWMFNDAGIKSILDVGCGCGLTVKALEGHGFEVFGTEICSSLLESDLKGMNVFPYDVEGMGSFPAGEYDLVIGVDLLPHLRDEEEVDVFFRESRRIGSKGMFVSVDCSDGLLARVYRLCGPYHSYHTKDRRHMGHLFLWKDSE